MLFLKIDHCECLCVEESGKDHCAGEIVADSESFRFVGEEIDANEEYEDDISPDE